MGLFRRRDGEQGKSAAPAAAAPVPAEPPAGLHMRRLLVADDNETVTQLLDMLFTRAGWHVSVVDSGEACLEVLEATDPDVIVLDQQMDGISGLETAKRLRRGGFDRPLLLFSGHLDDAARRASKRLGVDPVSKVDFPTVVRHVEEAYRRAREAGAAEAPP